MPLDERVRSELGHLDVNALRNLWIARFGWDWTSERQFTPTLMNENANVSTDDNTDFYGLVFWKLWRCGQLQTHTLWSTPDGSFINSYKLKDHANN